MITDIEDYFKVGCGRCKRFQTPECSTQQWKEGLKELRRICRALGLEETVKWGHPCYMHRGRNIALIGAFQKDFRLTFMNAALLKDLEGVLERRRPNTRHPDLLRFTEVADVVKTKAIIQTYLKEAMGYAEKGVKPPKEDKTIELPSELIDALDADPTLADAFHSLTPGRQRSYVINLQGAKKPETRRARIEKFRDKIFSGKGAMER